MQTEISRKNSRKTQVSFAATLAFGLTFSALPAAAADSAGDALSKMIDQANSLGERAAFLFDLDETIVDSTPRRFHSIEEAIDEACRGENQPADCAAVGGDRLRMKDLYRLRNRYDDHDYLRISGAEDAKFIDSVLSHAFQIYLSGKYIVEEDRLYPGAQAFIRALKNAGAQVFFSSARTAATQLAPTLEFLARRGLISAGENDHVYLKTGSESSVDFKRASAETIGDRMAATGGKVVGIFENEPENISVWSEVFPHAKAFFVQGAYMKDGMIPAKTVLLEDFRY